MTTHTVQFTRPSKPSALAQPSSEAQCWSLVQVEALFRLPFADLLYRAQQVHREHFDPNAGQQSGELYRVGIEMLTMNLLCAIEQICKWQPEQRLNLGEAPALRFA